MKENLAMPRYEVGVTRHFLVSIDAESHEDAKMLTECFLGNCDDASKEADREKFQFKIHEIEMVENEAFDV